MRVLSFINYAKKEVLEHFKNASIVNIASFKDDRFNQRFYKCELGTEAYVLALLCTMSEIASFDIGELSAESCIGEEEAEEILDFCKDLDLILLDNNLLYHNDNSIYYFAKKLADKYGAKILFDYELCDVEPKELLDNNGLVLYECLENDEFIVSPAFASLARLNDGDLAYVKTKDKEMKKTVKIDDKLKGLFGLSKKNSNYAFSPCVVKRLESEN